MLDWLWNKTEAKAVPRDDFTGYSTAYTVGKKRLKSQSLFCISWCLPNDSWNWNFIILYILSFYGLAADRQEYCFAKDYFFFFS